MNRRHYISILGTVGVSSAGIWLAYQLDQGNMSLGKESDISEEVTGNQESFEFEASVGDDIYITLTDTQDEPYRGAFSLYDPDENEVLNGRLSTSEMLNDVHTAEQEGTYRLLVDPRRGSLRVSVLIESPDE